MLYLAAVFLSFFLAFILLTKKGKSQADYILMAWLAVTGFHLTAFYLHLSGQYQTYPTILGLGIPLPLVQGPFLYLYTLRQTSPQNLKSYQWLHFLPVLGSYLMFSHFFFLPFEAKVETFLGQGHGFEVQSMINLMAIYISGVVYTILALMRLLKYRRDLVNEFSSTERINFNWLLYLIVWIAIIWIVIFVSKEDKLIFGAAALFILWLGYFGIRQNRVFSHAMVASQASISSMASNPILEKPQSHLADPVEANLWTAAPKEEMAKYQKSGLSDEDADRIHGQLRNLLDNQKPYTDPELTLTDLARLLNVHPNVLSQVINSREGKTFYDMVNERRTEEFMYKLSQPQRHQYTLMAIAYDCGFNSKASFNRNFKKYTGLTPSEYLGQLSA